MIFAAQIEAKERIIVLSPAINEIVYALGAGDEIVANTAYTTYPKEAQKKPKVGNYFSISFEKILSFRPTLVLMQKNSLFLKQKLQKLGIKTKFVRLSSLDDIKKAIWDISLMLHKEKKAKEILFEIDSKLLELKNIVENKKILIVFGDYYDLGGEIFIAGNNLYLSDIIKASGNKNAFSSKSERQPVLSFEGLVATNADIVYILSSKKKSDKARKRLFAKWRELPINASKFGTIYINEKKYASMPSQRVVFFIKDFKKILENAKSRFKKF